MQITWDSSLTWQVGSILIGSAVLHASFQVAISVLTSLSARHLGFNSSHTTLLKLTTSYMWGVAAAIVALLLSTTYLLSLPQLSTSLLWAIVAGYSAAIGVVVLLFYYRSGKGTALWLPREIATFLQKRVGKTNSMPESFALGLMTVVAELPFVIAPLAIAAMLLRGPSTVWHIVTIAAYTLITLLPLLYMITLVGGGIKLSRIQKWRETNKGFLQFAAGSGLIVVAGYVFVSYCLGA